MEKTINGLCYVSQTYLAEILDIERHAIKDWQNKYKLPIVAVDKYRLCCAPIYVTWYMTRAAFADNKNFPKNPGVIVAIGQLTGKVTPAKTTRLLQKGLNLTREKALLTVGMAAQWINEHLKSESHINI
ncbi:MAG: hypothetical protein QM504_15380, partial [Pseudomonadota bacterium]